MRIERCFGEAIYLFEFDFYFDTNISKNRSIGLNKGKVYKNTKHEQAKALATNACEKAMALCEISIPDKTKLYIDVMVYKANNRPDSFNVVDGICDAIQKPLGVNDRYYGGHIDYRIDKDNPRIEITISKAIEG